MTTLEILKAGRALIAEEARWTRKAFARDEYGIDVSNVLSEEAVCWCSLGVIEKVSKRLDEDAVCALEKHMLGGVINFNDHHPHATVLAAWDAAIAELEAE